MICMCEIEVKIDSCASISIQGVLFRHIGMPFQFILCDWLFFFDWIVLVLILIYDICIVKHCFFNPNLFTSWM